MRNDKIYDEDNRWEELLLASIIRCAVFDYETRDVDSKSYQSARRFLYKDAGKFSEKTGKPLNMLEYYCSYCDLEPDAIRKLINRRRKL